MSLNINLLSKLMYLLVFITWLFLIWHYKYMAFQEIVISKPQINIILIETKVGKRNLTSREACSVESAAFHHPDARITLYNVNGRMDESDKNVKNLGFHYSTIHFLPLNSSDIFIKTPLEGWSSEKRILESKYPTEHLSDALRLVLLWKHGGLYMDTDTIIIKTFYEFKNAIGLQTLNYLANGIMIFQKNSSFIYNLMQQYALFYNGSSWGNQGPNLLTKLMKIVCNVNSFETVINKPELCQGIQILPNNVFYPVPWQKWAKLFQIRTIDSLDYSQSYAVHLFGSHSRSRLVKRGIGAVVEKLFQDHCPKTYQLILKDKYGYL